MLAVECSPFDCTNDVQGLLPNKRLKLSGAHK
jgi:hypothetical protein